MSCDAFVLCFDRPLLNSRFCIECLLRALSVLSTSYRTACLLYRYVVYRRRKWWLGVLGSSRKVGAVDRIRSAGMFDHGRCHDGPRLRDCIIIGGFIIALWQFMHLTRCSESLSVHVDAYDP
jgi:hypothetical protein